MSRASARSRGSASLRPGTKPVSDPLWCWEAAEPLTRTNGGAKYLRTRAIDPSPLLGHRDIAFCRKQNALLLRLRDIDSDEPTGIQRIFLSANHSRRLNKRFTRGTRKKNSAFKVTDEGDSFHALHVCEGPEDALSLNQLGYRPVWCLLDKGNLSALPKVAGIAHLTIWADPDGLKEGEILGARWVADGCDHVELRWFEGARARDVKDINQFHNQALCRGAMI